MSLNRPRLDLTILQASTFSGARQARSCWLPGWMRPLSVYVFYKQKSPPKCMKLTRFMSWGGNPERSHTVLVKSRDKNFRLIPSRKIPGSRDFAKSRPGNPGIENSWSRWSLLVIGSFCNSCDVLWCKQNLRTSYFSTFLLYFRNSLKCNWCIHDDRVGPG